MTREEAEYFLRGISYKLGNIAVEYLSEKDGEKMREAIKALEQETTTKIEESNFSQEQYIADIQSAYDCGKSVIDKIRAEIMEIFDKEKDVEPMWALGLKYSTHIIDKYKAESEET